MRVYTGDDGESHLEELSPEFTDREGTRTPPQQANGITFAHRADGSFIDFHPAPRDQYVLYLLRNSHLLGMGAPLYRRRDCHRRHAFSLFAEFTANRLASRTGVPLDRQRVAV